MTHFYIGRAPRERYNTPCKVVARHGNRSPLVLIEFEDGARSACNSAQLRKINETSAEALEDLETRNRCRYCRQLQAGVLHRGLCTECRLEVEQIWGREV